MIASFAIEGVPVAKGRPRLTTRGGHARAYTPEKTRSFEAIVAERARASVGPMDAYAGPVEVEAYFILPIPKSWRKADRIKAAAGGVPAASKPDLDNYFKAIADGMNGVVYADDAQIVRALLVKRYGEEPGVVVTVRAA